MESSDRLEKLDMCMDDTGHFKWQNGVAVFARGKYKQWGLAEVALDDRVHLVCARAFCASAWL